MTNPFKPTSVGALIGALTCAAIFPTLALSANLSPQGDTWDSIKKLPDWSGIFSLDRAGHEFAGKESRSDDHGLVPLTDKGKQLRADAEHSGKQPNLGNCLPAGVPGVMLHTMLTEFLFTPGRVTMMFEDGEVRRIYTSRKTHLALDDLRTSYMGDSIGHWEGNTLVVDTVGFPKGELFQNGGLRATLQTHYVERFFLKDKDHIEVDGTIDDPALFAKPYTAARVFQREHVDQMQEPMCAQSTHDVGDDVDLTPPAE